MGEQRSTFCRICEPMCGLDVTVEDERVLTIRPDREHPLSRGNACPKGIAFSEIQNDPDRVLYPLRRLRDGSFERTTWEAALGDIGQRLVGIRRRHGGAAVGWYMGNPGSLSYSHPLWMNAFMQALGSRHVYTAASQDVNARFVASQLLYGSPVRIPIPDLGRTDFLLIVGANPLVSHGSTLHAPRIKDQLNGIVRRGGRVVVVDPRRSETARAYEHISVAPDADAWLLLSLLHVIFAEDGVNPEILLNVSGLDELREACEDFGPEVTQERTGVPADECREMAKAFAAAPRASTYGRTGSCLGRWPTLVCFLIDAIAIVTGNLDAPGGSIFGRSPLPAQEVGERLGFVGYANGSSRIGEFPDVLGSFPASIMAKEIVTPGPGPGQLHALFVSAGNPILTVPNSHELDAALPELELMVSVDIYVNDTNRHADYILPGTTFLEREDIPMTMMGMANTPFAQWTEPVVSPYGQARQEWAIIEDIAGAAGIALFMPPMLQRLLGRRPIVTLLRRIRPQPRRVMDLLLRTGPKGDWFGIRRKGLSIRKLAAAPHGLKLGDFVETGRLRRVVRHRDRRVQLAPAAIIEEIRRLPSQFPDDQEFPMRLIGLREHRSLNSWMHNAPALMSGQREHRARISPVDATRYALDDGAPCVIESAHGAITVPIRVTDEIRPGTVAVPHGWGHRGGGWQLANAAGGDNVNVLTSSDPSDIERLSGTAHLNGVPVRIRSAKP